MGFLDEVAAQQREVEKRRPQNQCQVKLWLEDQDDETRAEFEVALAIDSGYDATSIFRVLRARGSTVSLPSVRRHRRAECTCPLTPSP